MTYYFSKKVNRPFAAVIEEAVEKLKAAGFGVLTDIDVKATLKEKMNVDFPEYRILGTCNPPFAYKALLAENKIGTMLPCNVIVREDEDGSVEVAAVDPLASMKAIENAELGDIAHQVRDKLRSVVEAL